MVAMMHSMSVSADILRAFNKKVSQTSAKVKDSFVALLKKYPVVSDDLDDSRDGAAAADDGRPKEPKC